MQGQNPDKLLRKLVKSVITGIVGDCCLVFLEICLNSDHEIVSTDSRNILLYAGGFVERASH